MTERREQRPCRSPVGDGKDVKGKRRKWKECPQGLGLLPSNASQNLACNYCRIYSGTGQDATGDLTN